MNEGSNIHDQIASLQAQLKAMEKQHEQEIIAGRPKAEFSYEVVPIKKNDGYSLESLEADLGGIRIKRTCENYEAIHAYAKEHKCETGLEWPSDCKITWSVNYTYYNGFIYISSGGTHLLDFRTDEEKARNTWTMGKYALDAAEWEKIKSGDLSRYLWERKS